MSNYYSSHWFMEEPSNEPEVHIWWHFQECGHETEDWIQPGYLKNYKQIGEDIYVSHLSECSACHNRRVSRKRSGLGPGYRPYED